MSRIAVVVVPFIKTDLHRTLADECLDSIQSTHEVDRVAIVNAIRSDDDVQWLQERFDCVEYNDVNILARAWNRGIRRALDRGADLVIVSNLDVIFHPLCLDNLLRCSEEQRDAVVWSPVAWRDPNTFAHAQLLPQCAAGVSWSCFSVNRRLFDVVGEFDEGFVPAYQEDSDMVYRMRLAGLQGVSCRAALVCDYGRGTIKGLFGCLANQVTEFTELLADLRSSVTKNDERYIRKWGGLGGAECFTTPFNGEKEE